MNLTAAASGYFLVEDNPLNMEIACELIGMTGAMIEEATDGAAALTKIAQGT